MAFCELCNKKISFLSTNSIFKVGDVCDECKEKYDLIENAVNSCNTEKYNQLKREFLERSNSTQNLKKVDDMLAELDKMLENNQKKQEEEKEKKEKEALLEKQEKEKEERINSIPVTTTDSIGNKNYSSNTVFLSTTQVVDTGLYIREYKISIEEAKREAVNILKHKAYDENCDAVLGLKFEFIHFVTENYVNTYMSAYATGIKLILDE